MKTWQQVRSILTDRDVFLCAGDWALWALFLPPFDNADKVEINKGECAVLFPLTVDTVTVSFEVYSSRLGLVHFCAVWHSATQFNVGNAQIERNASYRKSTLKSLASSRVIVTLMCRVTQAYTSLFYFASQLSYSAALWSATSLASHLAMCRLYIHCLDRMFVIRFFSPCFFFFSRIPMR